MKRKTKTFTVYTHHSHYSYGILEVPYLRSFRKFGETFVLHRPIFDGRIQKTGFSVAHRDTGARVGFASATQSDAISEARRLIHQAGADRLKRCLLLAAKENAKAKTILAKQ